jgi:hypothetical protein
MATVIGIHRLSLLPLGPFGEFVQRNAEGSRKRYQVTETLQIS